MECWGDSCEYLVAFESILGILSKDTRGQWRESKVKCVLDMLCKLLNDKKFSSIKNDKKFLSDNESYFVLFVEVKANILEWFLKDSMS